MPKAENVSSAERMAIANGDWEALQLPTNLPYADLLYSFQPEKTLTALEFVTTELLFRLAKYHILNPNISEKTSRTVELLINHRLCHTDGESGVEISDTREACTELVAINQQHSLLA